ncbi:MAG: coenzyme F420-0:L-glutamate ligase, partial [Actinomycetota bacterium]|nr:coenzyme F420-0:L-glutamate ligase [Actinomycetota bacterium]
MLVAAALPGIPEVRAGDDLGALLVAAAGTPAGGDVLVVAHKIVSKAEGRTIALADVQPGALATQLAAEHGKDPRLVEVILGETEQIVRSRPGVLICRTRHGFVCANAGVDASNAGTEGELVLLPHDADASARALRAGMRAVAGIAPAIVIADSFGRAWRVGQCDV